MERRRRCWCRSFCLSLCLILAAGFAALIWYVDETSKSPRITVEMIGISGLDPVKDLQGQGSLNPAFNLTIAVTSRSKLRGACMRPATSLKVSYSYQHLPLATGLVPDFCVGPLQSREKPVVARGTGVVVPGYLLDSLAEEMRRGDPTVEIMLMTRIPHEGRENWDRMVCLEPRLGEKASCHDVYP